MVFFNQNSWLLRRARKIRRSLGSLRFTRWRHQNLVFSLVLQHLSVIGISFCVKNCKEKVFQKRCVRNSFRSFFFEVGKLGPEEEVVPTTVVKTKHGLSIKVAEKQKLQDCLSSLFFETEISRFFSLSFHLFFLTVRTHQLALSAQTLFFFSFYSLKQKKTTTVVFFSFLAFHIKKYKTLFFSLTFFFFSTQHKLLTEFPHQELFFLSFCSIRLPGPGHKANLFLFLGVPIIGAP